MLCLRTARRLPSQALHHRFSSPITRLSSSTVAEPDPIAYHWINGVEALASYQPGGYHPIMIGDTLNNRYRIVDKLGSGGYATVWLARDNNLATYVALKVCTADAHPRETRVLRALCASEPARDFLPALHDEYKIQGPNGTHLCYTVTLAQCDLREISYSRLFPLDAARGLCYGVAQAVAAVHSEGYVHGDIHLNNILARLPSKAYHLSIEELYEKFGDPETVAVTHVDGKPLPPNVPSEAVKPLFLGKYAEKFLISDARPLLSDFGEAFAPESETRLGRDSCTPAAFRAPEARFEPDAPLSYPADIWSLATAVWDVMGMKEEVVANWVDVLGPFPSDWWARWEGRGKYFTEHGKPTEWYEKNKWEPLEEAFDTCLQIHRRRWGGEICEEERVAFLSMIRQMLVYRPEERLSAEQVMESEWMVKWAYPDYKRSFEDPR
ncbi:kinase-like domain-containing protein [Aspergillus carlsbadensis]|nr:kinase-like domain-containing protein [Aspergillus carlsbadensis]